MDFTILLLLGASLAINLAGAWQLRLQCKRSAVALAALSKQGASELAALAKQSADELAAQKKRPAPTLSAEEILHDLTASGRALIRIERINEADVFLRSPRT